MAVGHPSILTALVVLLVADTRNGILCILSVEVGNTYRTTVGATGTYIGCATKVILVYFDLYFKQSKWKMADKRTTTDIVNARRIINGPSDMLRAVSATRYPWTRDVWKKMIANTWFVENVSLTRDAVEYPELESGQQQAVCRALGFLSNLDSIQVDNLTRNVATFITDPTIQQLMRRQAAEEDIHVETYSAIVETVIKDPMAVYDLYRHVPQLAAKNDYIIHQSEEVVRDPSDRNKVKALVSNMILEGVYFFSGFLTFYTIGRSTGKIQGVIDDIKYIQRDEVTHFEFFQLTYLSLRQERPELFTPELAAECRELFRKAAELEASWGHFLIEGGVLGLTPQIITQYVQWLAEQRAVAIGLGGIFPDVKNPVNWVDDYSRINNGQSNFFEAKPQTYSHRKPTFTRSGSSKTV